MTATSAATRSVRQRCHDPQHGHSIVLLPMAAHAPYSPWARAHCILSADLQPAYAGYNGYDERHIKDKLKPVIARFRTSETQNARCTLDGPKLEHDELTTIRQVVSHA